MEADGVKPGDTGFDEIAEIVGHFYEFRNNEPVHKIRMHSRGGVGMTAEETVWVYYEDHWDSDSTDAVGVGSVYKRLTKELDSSEARFRVVGFSLLASGFLLQFAGTVFF